MADTKLLDLPEGAYRDELVSIAEAGLKILGNDGRYDFVAITAVGFANVIVELREEIDTLKREIAKKI